MLTPEKGVPLEAKIYNSIFGISIRSEGDYSIYTGIFGSSRKTRML